MEKKCCICGLIFNGFGNNAEPVRKGVCCESCNSRFIVQSRILNWAGTFEIVKSSSEMANLETRLKEKNFEPFVECGSLKRFQNVETEENVIVCMV